jgi:Putative Zn-dependent protease, contains TPR repeats
MERGKALMDSRKYAEARAVLEPIGKSDAIAAFYLGQIAMEQNDAGKAVDWFEKAVALNPRSSVYYDWLGRAYGEQAQRASKLKLPFLAGKNQIRVGQVDRARSRQSRCASGHDRVLPAGARISWRRQRQGARDGAGGRQEKSLSRSGFVVQSL